MKGEKLEATKEEIIEKYLSAKEVAKKLSIGVSTVYDWVKKGKLKPIKIGNKTTRYKNSDIEKYIRSLNECEN